MPYVVLYAKFEIYEHIKQTNWNALHKLEKFKNITVIIKVAEGTSLLVGECLSI